MGPERHNLLSTIETWKEDKPHKRRRGKHNIHILGDKKPTKTEGVGSIIARNMESGRGLVSWGKMI